MLSVTMQTSIHVWIPEATGSDEDNDFNVKYISQAEVSTEHTPNTKIVTMQTVKATNWDQIACRIIDNQSLLQLEKN